MRTEPRVPLSIWTTPKMNRQYCHQRIEFRRKREGYRKMQQSLKAAFAAEEAYRLAIEPEKVTIQ